MAKSKVFFAVFMAVWLIGLLIVTPFNGADAQSATPTETNQPVAKRILIVSLDGLRPDLVLRGDTPTLHRLLPQSSFSFWARTTPHAITLPSHTSMMTGVIPRKHEVEWNRDSAG